MLCVNTLCPMTQRFQHLDPYQSQLLHYRVKIGGFLILSLIRNNSALISANSGKESFLSSFFFWIIIYGHKDFFGWSLDCKEIQPVHSEGDQPWDFFGRNDAKTETPVLWPPHVKSWLIGKDSDAGRDWVQEEKGTTENEMAGWHHWLNGRESQWTPGVGDGQGGLACCDSWGRKESDTTEWLI